jgi:hypothetical protein
MPGQYNYYDAGNGITYVYDHNWNYVGTHNPMQAQAMSGAMGGGGGGRGIGAGPGFPGAGGPDPGIWGPGVDPYPTVTIGNPFAGATPGTYPGMGGPGGGSPFAGATPGTYPGMSPGGGDPGGGSPGFNGPSAAPGAPWYTAGPYPGGAANPQNPGYVAPGVGPQSTPSDFAPGSGFSTTLGGGFQLNARNI